MADISVLARLLNGALRNVDLTNNTPVVLSIKVGGGVSNTELTKTLVDNLVTLSGGGDAGSLHNHNGAYNTKTELSSSTSSSGSDLVGDDNTYSNFTPAAATVKGAFSGIDTAIGAISGTKVKVSATDTTSGYLDESITAGSGLSKSITNPSGDEVLDLAVNVDGSTIEINTDALRVKDGGITNAKVATGIDAAKIGDGSVSNTEFQYLDGVTSAIQTQLGNKISSSEKGANNGVATLDAGGKVPVSQLPNAVMTYEGTFDASATPASPLLNGDGAANAGMVYLASVAGSFDFGAGAITFAVGDWAVYNGSIWEKSVNSNSVVSVNGQTGVVSLSTTNISEGTNLYFSDERAQDAVGTALTDTATIDFTYTDASNQITADVKSNSISETHLTASVAGNGLAGGNGTALSVNVDSSTIEINTDALRVKASGITSNELASDAVTTVKITDANVTLAKLASDSVDENKIKSTALGSGLTGGSGTVVSVTSAPLMKRTLVAGEAFAANTSFIVRWALTGETAGRVYKADKDASSTSKYMAIGIALSTGAVSAGGNIDVVMMGEYTLGSSDSAFASGDVGKEVFVGTTGAMLLGSGLANTVNEAQFCIGVVQNTNKVWIDAKQLRGIM